MPLIVSSKISYSLSPKVSMALIEDHSEQESHTIITIVKQYILFYKQDYCEVS